MEDVLFTASHLEADLLTLAGCDVRPCGIGLAAAPAGVVAQLSGRNVCRVVFLGIAGTCDPLTHPIGTADRFHRFEIDGIGVGEGSAFRSPTDLGWAREEVDPVIGDGGPTLLTVTAASADPRQANARRRRHPDAVAEDMESYAVAGVCRSLDIPLMMIRGFSNVAGDRNHDRWKIREALEAAVACYEIARGDATA